MTDPAAPCDLHLHSFHSDGILSPAELVRRARGAGLAAIAIADHDTIAGQAEAIEAGGREGVDIVTAVEFSLIEAERDIHLLGYCVDPADGPLSTALAELAAARIERARVIVEKIREAGVDISFDDVRALAGRGSIGRPHVARALLRAGAISSFYEAFARYIGPDGPAYVPKRVLALETVVELVHGAGGVAVWAHPGRMVNDEPLLGRLLAAGVRGLEATHPNHNNTTVALIVAATERFGLVATGGSDFHFDEAMKADIGESTVPYRIVEELRRLAGGR
ncbi:MAG: PHP domain-containing protein [Candidatus Krumholzibacteriota bacterium]|nr:PHP domain-containing protein [Candidatus Krumholzibacteriota bacterium]